MTIIPVVQYTNKSNMYSLYKSLISVRPNLLILLYNFMSLFVKSFR